MITAIAKKSGITEEQDLAWRRKLAVVCRILGLQGHIGLFGHISVRVPKTDVVYITPGAGYEKTTVRADEIFVYDVEGKIHHHPGGDKPMNIPVEWRIHTQIHQDRPEVGCVAHLHAHASTLLGVADKPIVPVHARGALFSDVPVWDNPRLVLDDPMAKSLSHALGGRLACQMRGHGSVVVGETLETALVACTYIEENAQMQIEAAPLGGARPLNAEEIADCAKGALGVWPKLWTYWEPKALSAGPL
jgi:ribulose-5-phosphate 4-epimerase/fuculose-1-phosphate aldolase